MIDESNLIRTTFELAIPGPAPDDSAGGLVAADLDGSGTPDLLITHRGHIAAYRSNGEALWTKAADIQVTGQSESKGLPGHNGPGIAAGDVNADGRAEVIYLTRDSLLHVVDAATGTPISTAKPPVPEGAERWEVAMVADFRGTGGDTDILLQATNAEGYRTGRFLAAYRFDALIAGGEPMWSIDDFKSCAHNSARLADIDQDGRDEVLGETILDHDGTVLVAAAEYEGHMDSVFAADVVPQMKGLEVLLLEEGSNHVQVLGQNGVIWREANTNRQGRGREPQNAAVGRFMAASDEVFIWCRSRHQKHQTPFVFNSDGRMVAAYEMDHKKPVDWTDSGVEVIHTIDWTGATQQLACATERHKRGDVCVFEPLTGNFLIRIPQRCDRLYVADVQGDWREEIVVLSGNEMSIYRNVATNPRPGQPRLWQSRNYRRLKQCHNYYSP